MSKHSKSILNNWRLWVAILMIAGLISISIITVYKNKTENVSSNTNTEYTMIGKKINLTSKMKNEMYKKVKKDITDSLKTPSTAIFPTMKEWHIDVNYNNVIEVKSYVDSQNSYGAMLRAEFEQQYIITNKNEYLCIYKEFNNETEFDITERAENKEVINKNVNKTQIDNFVRKSTENQYSILYNKTIDYSFNEETQQLEWSIKVTSQSKEDLKNNCYLTLTAVIDECICIPTVNTNIYVYYDNQKIATVKDINFEFMTRKWNILYDIGINTEHLTTNFEEELGERLAQEEILKGLKIDYWNN